MANLSNKELEKRGLFIEKDTNMFIFQEQVELTNVLDAQGKTVEYRVGNSAPVESIPTEIYPVICAINGDKQTKNKTFYPREELIGRRKSYTGVFSWIYPYEVPVLIHHNEESGEPVGRVVAARYIESTDPDYSGGGSSNGWVALVPKITDRDTITKILDGRYHTVSIGVSAENVKCSVCKKNPYMDECTHYRGQTYIVEGKEVPCYYILEGIHAREVSFVNTPSDDQARVTNPDLGRQGAMAWAKQRGAVSTFTESAVSTKIIKSLEGFNFSESFKEENRMEFKDLDDLLQTINSIAEMKAKGETPDEKLVKRVQEAVVKAGISDDYITRVTVSEMEGIPFLPKAFKEFAPVSEELSKFFTEETQKEVSLKELPTLFKSVEDYISALNAKYNESLTSVSEKDDEIKQLKDSLSEWETKTKAALDGEINSLNQKISKLSAKLEKKAQKEHETLARALAVELIRANSPLAKKHKYDKLVEILSKRSKESLTDAYNDAIASYVKTSNPVNLEQIERTTNPTAAGAPTETSEAAKFEGLRTIQEMIKKHNISVPATETIPAPRITQDDPQQLEFIQYPDGTAEVRLKEKISSQTINLDALGD